MEQNNKQIKVKLTTIISLMLIVVIILVVTVLVFLILNVNNDEEDLPEFNIENYESFFKDNPKTFDFNVNEEYTDLSYYYITEKISSSSNSSEDDYNNFLKEVSYVRYVYQDNNWVLAENKENSPFFNQTGNGIIIDSENYYIPIYELEEGKNKVVVTETTNGGTKKEKEFIINRTPSEYDNMYQIKAINNSDTLVLNTYQDVININMYDYPNILLTGSFYSNYDIADISWTRYEHKINSEEWEVIPESQNNSSYYQSKGKAKIISNYWAIDILSTNSNGEKVEITATDLSGAKITTTVLINNNSNSEDFSYTINDKDISEDGSFITNHVVISFSHKIKESRRKDIINEINGEVIDSVTRVSPIQDPSYVIQLNYKFSTESSVFQYCELLKEKYSEIVFALPDSLSGLASG